VTVNPSIAEGLAVCSRADYARERYDSAPGEGCPQASKIGSVQISTPLLAEELRGAVYQATPYENETDSLIGLYLVARAPERGILVKQPIEVRPDPATGQLVSVAENVPQLSFDSFRFHFRDGARSPLITPPGCGTFHTVAKFTPWSAADPHNPAPSEVVENDAEEGNFTIEGGVEGGACPQGPAPFRPDFEAGTLNNQAGSYSPFVMHLRRQDGEQDMGRFSFALPPGVLARLASIPYCPEVGIARAKARQGPHGGAEELADPSCPAASKIGRTLAGAGVGNQLTHVPGSLYLAGPWHGDPLSVVAITPALAGPFDAGTVVVREALRLNPVTARAEVDGAASDPIPHILKGIPLNLRDLRVFADRSSFALNATSCEPSQAQSTIWGDGTALEPLGQTPVALASRYQAAGCASLGFKPRLGLRLKGGTRRGAFPALRAAYVPRKRNQANLSRLALTFPNSAFIEQGHFRTICTRVQFAAGPGHGALCPKGARYGTARVWTPLLEEPLRGPVILRSSDHNLPDAVFALRGPPTAAIEIEVAVRIDSVKGRLRATVEKAPDAPVSRAIVDMQGGQKGLFVNSRHLCFKPGRNRAKANLRAQNGRFSRTRPIVGAVRCAKKRKARRASLSRARIAPTDTGGHRPPPHRLRRMPRSAFAGHGVPSGRLPASVSAVPISLDTRAVADGARPLRVEVTDGAGNTATLLDRTIVVRNAPHESGTVATVKIGVANESGGGSEGGKGKGCEKGKACDPGKGGEKGKGLALKRKRCRAPHLAMRLAKRPLWHTRTRHVPVLWYGHRYPYRGKLTCRSAKGKRFLAPRGTPVTIYFRVWQLSFKRYRGPVRFRRVRTVRVGRKGRINTKLRFKSGRTVMFRYHGPRSELAKAKLRLAIPPKSRKPPWGPR